MHKKYNYESEKLKKILKNKFKLFKMITKIYINDCHIYIYFLI